jgi:SAM-dependent methyltransferase
LSYIHSGACSSFLDIGCGAGIHAHFWGHASSLQACANLLEAAAGVEICDAARHALAQENIDSWATIRDVPQDRRFSLIRMNWSLEHVHAPNDYFSFISARLLPGGRAVITVPNHEGLIYRIAPDCLELPIHLYHFRLRDIEAYGARHSLRIIHSRTFSYPGMFAQAARASMLPPSFLAAENLSNARKMQDILRMFDAAGMGNDLLVVLEK